MAKFITVFLMGIFSIFFSLENPEASYRQQQEIKFFSEVAIEDLISLEEFARKEKIGIFKGKIERILRIKPRHIAELMFFINKLDEIKNNLEENAELFSEEDPEFSELYWEASRKIKRRAEFLRKELEIKMEDKKIIQKFFLENIDIK